MSSSVAAKTVFEKFLDEEITPSVVWGPRIQGSYGDYLLGSDVMKLKVLSEINESQSNISCIPLYILNYLYDTEELSPADLLLVSSEESAQYSLHAVGLVFDRTHKRIIVADPNGALIPGSNMEFVQIPLLCRSKASTKLSTYDITIKKRKLNS
jgi:hypothetical protein